MAIGYVPWKEMNLDQSSSVVHDSLEWQYHQHSTSLVTYTPPLAPLAQWMPCVLDSSHGKGGNTNSFVPVEEGHDPFLLSDTGSPAANYSRVSSNVFLATWSATHI